MQTGSLLEETQTDAEKGVMAEAMAGLDALFVRDSVAVTGATERPGRNYENGAYQLAELRTAKEPPEHRRIAKYYRQQAERLTNSAKEHQELAATYENKLPFRAIESRQPLPALGSIGSRGSHNSVSLSQASRRDGKTSGPEIASLPEKGQGIELPRRAVEIVRRKELNRISAEMTHHNLAISHSHGNSAFAFVSGPISHRSVRFSKCDFQV